MDNVRTELAQLGEFGLIERLSSKVELQNSATVRGIGDDAAVIAPPVGQRLLISTDTMVEGIHFDLTYTPLKHLGYKAVVSNVSDIAAMMGKPSHITVSLAVSNRFSVEAIEELYSGMLEACKNYGVDLVGGDVTSSLKGLIITVSIVGFAEPEKVVYRHTAKPGDILCVTGDLGAAFMGLQILRREKEEFTANPHMQPQLEGTDYILKRQLKPEARTDMVAELQERGIVPTAMIDVSDGLASELLHICRQSGTGAHIFEDKLPIHAAALECMAEWNLSAATCALNGGEDYELLFTISQADYDKIKLHDDISFIGYVTAPDLGIYMTTNAGQKVELKAQGWVHF